MGGYAKHNIIASPKSVPKFTVALMCFSESTKVLWGKTEIGYDIYDTAEKAARLYSENIYVQLANNESISIEGCSLSDAPRMPWPDQVRAFFQVEDIISYSFWLTVSDLHKYRQYYTINVRSVED